MDDMIFQRRMIHRLVADGVIRDDELGSADGRLSQESIRYIHPYFAAHALRDESSQSTLGRIRRTAQVVCELDGGCGVVAASAAAGSEAIRSCIEALLPLAAKQGRGLLSAREEPATDEGLRADIQMAAVWLGKTAHVARLVAEESVRFCQLLEDEIASEAGRATGSIFVHSVRAAAMQGNVEMLQVVLGALEPPRQ